MSPHEASWPVREIPIHLIDDPVLPSRSTMDDEKLDELTMSIRAEGIIQNLVLMSRGERYEVVAGHRRLIAARRAGLVAVPAKVYPPDHPSLRVIQAHENGKREDVNAVDEAFWFAELLERDCGQDVDRLAALVGERRSYVEGRLALLELDDLTRNALQAGQIKIGVAQELNKCSDLSYRRYYLEHAIRGGATLSVVSGWIAEWKNIQDATRAQPPAPARTAGPVVVEPYDPHRCYICQKSDPRFIPEQLAVHTHCRLAILDELLAGAGAKAGADS